MKIYVGNLSYDVTNTDLQEVFASYGQVVSANVIRDRYSGESRGFGFVELADREQGETAIRELEGKELKGRRLKVGEAQQKPRPERRGGGGGGGHRGGGGGFRR